MYNIKLKGEISLIFFFILSISSFASENNTQIIKYGYFDLGSYYKTDQNGNIDSYDSSFLTMIEEYIPYKFIYINCGTWNNAIKMLKNHEIDLVGTMQWTKERENDFEICDSNYGYTIAELAAHPESNLIYEDYENIQNKTVGFIYGYVIEEQLNNLMKEKNLSFNLRRYKTQTELDNALDNREIDLIAANSHAIHQDWKLVEKFAYAPFYFASWKGNSELIDKISETIIQIKIHQPEFDDKLIEKYFPAMVYSPFNKEEITCIEKNLEYDVYFDSSTNPVVWYDKPSNTMMGVLVEICEKIEKLSGLKFRYLRSEDSEIKETATTVTYHTLYYNGKQDYKKNKAITHSIIDQTFKLYHYIGDVYEKEKPYKIAVVRNRDGIIEYLQKTYPLCEVIEYKSPKLCLEDIQKGNVDLAFLSVHVAENIIITESLNSIASIPFTDIIMGIALEFHGEDAETLCKIVNKASHLFGNEVESQSLLKHVQNTTPKNFFRFLIQQHFSITIFILLFLFLFILTFSFLIIYTRIIKKDKNRVIKINEERSTFFARMSHELRNPMNGILGMIELSEKTDDIFEIKDNLKKAKGSGKYILTLINDILDMRCLETKQTEIKSQIVYLKKFIEDITDIITPVAKQKQIKIIFENQDFNFNRYIKINELRLKQVFINILSNAIKFTPSEGCITVQFKTVKKIGNIEKEIILFKDTGIGMSPDFLKNYIFKPYSQEKNPITEQTTGSGLGLAISKNIIELMGGHIEVESELGQGTCFTIYIDFTFVNNKSIEKKDTEKKDLTLPLAKRLKDLHVLVCEDQKINADVIKRILETAGCIVTIANNGKEGLLTFQNSKVGEYNVIIMDMRMPIMSGTEATRAIRLLERKDARSIPIIAMTANAYEEDRKECLESGMNEHLAKPIGTMKLYETIIHCLEKKLML